LAGCGVLAPFSVKERITKWVHVGGVEDANGDLIEKPFEVEYAEIVDGIAQRYGVLPSSVLDEDVRVLHYIEAVESAKGSVNNG
jgi:hypothetical protein